MTTASAYDSWRRPSSVSTPSFPVLMSHGCPQALTLAKSPRGPSPASRVKSMAEAIKGLGCDLDMNEIIECRPCNLAATGGFIANIEGKKEGEYKPQVSAEPETLRLTVAGLESPEVLFTGCCLRGESAGSQDRGPDCGTRAGARLRPVPGRRQLEELLPLCLHRGERKYAQSRHKLLCGA